MVCVLLYRHDADYDDRVTYDLDASERSASRQHKRSVREKKTLFYDFVKIGIEV